MVKTVPDFDAQQLLGQAKAARQQAYAPYSNFAVGAALLTESGEVFLGCNVENASYGLTNCAERTAVYNAIAAGHRSFVAIALCLKDAATPCGACRQVLNEFNPSLAIVIGDDTGKLHTHTSLEALLPNAFGPSAL